MADYILRRVPPEVWAAFKAKARADGLEMRTLLLLLVRAYAEGKVAVTAHHDQS